MKKIILVTLTCFLIILLFYRSNSSEKPNLPISEAEIESIEVYSFTVPMDSEKKIITEKDDIEYILKRLKELKVKKSYKYPENDTYVGTSTLSFRFNLFDNQSIDIIYSSGEENHGILKSSYVFYYETEGDLITLWEDLKYDSNKATEAELPTYEQ